MTNLTVWILALPLFGFVVLSLTGRVIARPAVLTVALGTTGIAFLFALISFLSIRGAPPSSPAVGDQVIYTWVTSGVVGAGPGATPFAVNFGLLYDPLSAVMLLVITGVGFLIHIYSAGYMGEESDSEFSRYFSYMNFFIFAMALLVSADNFLFLLVGWGLVGLASFLLIGFWFQRRSARDAARKALVINVIGDFGLMLALFLIFKTYGTLNFYTDSNGNLGALNQAAPGSITTIICLLLFIACAAKSAQLPLYMWLPDAMEGPTPVSALIHAATMVTAGVYLVARAHTFFEASPTALLIVAVIGGLTAIFAASIAVAQLDIKRILAYSTISQLGYMFMAEGAHDYSAGMLHLITHAYFKALLFLGAGAVIHALGGEQDMRKMGGLRHRLKITFWTFLIAALAISGIPPLSGFWSKDEILGSLLAHASTTPGKTGLAFYALWAIGLITAGLTAFYMFRLVMGVFFGSYRGSGPAQHTGEVEEGTEVEEHIQGHGGFYRIYEAPAVMTIPLIILAFFSVVGGWIASFSLVGARNWHPLATFLSPVFTRPAWSTVPVATPVASLTLQWASTGLSVGLAVLGILGAVALYRKGFAYKESKNSLYQLVFHKYYIDEILNDTVVQPVLWLGSFASRLLEGNMLDGGSRGIGWIFSRTSAGLRRLQTGYMRNYALAILFGVILIIIYYAVRG